MFNAMTDDALSEAMVDRVAKALFEHQVNRARLDLEATEFSLDDIDDLFLELRHESDAGLAIISTSYIDSQLEHAWRRNMPSLTGKSDELLFDNDGPLSTMSAKIRLAHALGWLTDTDAADLHLMRRIRNRFAHDPQKRTFDDSEIKAWVNSMVARERAPLEAMIPIAKRDHPSFSGEFALSPRVLFHLRAMMVSVDAALTMRTVPIAHGHQVPAGAVIGRYEDGPKIVRDLRLRQARLLWKIAFSALKLREPSLD